MTKFLTPTMLFVLNKLWMTDFKETYGNLVSCEEVAVRNIFFCIFLYVRDILARNGTTVSRPVSQDTTY